MVSFAFPAALVGLLIVPALLAAYRIVRARAARAGSARRLVGTGRPSGLGRITPALLLAALALLVVAAARPQASVSELRRQGTVVLAFDVSRSMSATDVEPSRLAAATAAARGFVAQAPSSIRIGVVAFGDSGVVLARPGDPAAALAALDRLTAQGGTSLGQGIVASLTAVNGGKPVLPETALAGDLDEADIGYLGSAVVVLLSDGEDRSRIDPVKLAELASVAGVRIDTVGIGNPQGTTITVDGVSAATALDEQLLTAVAEATGGHYRAAAGAADLQEVYATIDLKLTAAPTPTEISALVLVVALLLLVAGAGRAVLRTGRLI